MSNEHPVGAKYDRLIARAKEVPPAKTIVVHPCDETSLRGAVEAAELGIIVPTLVGPRAKIENVAREHASISANMSWSTRRTAMPRPSAASSSCAKAKVKC